MCQRQNPFHQVSYCKKCNNNLPHQVEKGHASLFFLLKFEMFFSKCQNNFLQHFTST
jgi:hypothetical protein